MIAGCQACAWIALQTHYPTLLIDNGDSSVRQMYDFNISLNNLIQFVKGEFFAYAGFGVYDFQSAVRGYQCCQIYFFFKIVDSREADMTYSFRE